ncbi:serine hydrolase [Embleya sp. NPDC059237]|uniref:serine hydrolase n=1 Tax=Embleya sp. NPDC059237 TaxID=3346784 RepID=UPI003692B55B
MRRTGRTPRPSVSRRPGSRTVDWTGVGASRGTRTTARDMVDLLELIWTDHAEPAAACARVRAVMARQLTRRRIASTFRSPVRVAAKSGSLLGVIRNEVGVISYPDGGRHGAAAGAVAALRDERP